MSNGTVAALDDQSTRERILRVAVSLFYERGYRGTSLTAIAREVGISAPALYWHFSSKREICFVAVYEELSRFVSALEPCESEEMPQAQLDEFVRSYVLLKLEQHERLKTPGVVGAYGQLREALPAKQRTKLDTLQRRVLEQLREILRAGERAGTFRFADCTATSFAIVTMCEYVFSWVRTGGRLSPEAVADLYVDLVSAMVRGEPEKR